MQLYINELTITDILQFSKYLKEKCAPINSFDEMAQKFTQIVYESFVTNDGKPSFALVRFFKTCSYANLPEQIKNYIQTKEPNRAIRTEDNYLTLMGTYGDLEEWRRREKSKNYQAFFLENPQFHDKFSMFSAVFKQIGIEALAGSNADMRILVSERHKRFGLFCVEDAPGNKLIPKQSEFVGPYSIQSSFGFGGIYPTGNTYLVMIFSREKITKDKASLFLSLNPAAKWISLPHELQGNVFCTDAHANSAGHDTTARSINKTREASTLEKHVIDVEKEKAQALIEELEMSNEYLLKMAEDLNKSNSAIMSSEEKLKKITDSAFDAIVMIDKNGLINYWNSSAETLFGYTKDEVLGKDVHKVIVPESYYESYLQGMEMFKINGTGAVIGKKLVLPARKKDGTVFSAEHSFAAFRSNGDWNAVSIIRDYTEHQRHEDEIRDINKSLEVQVAQRTRELEDYNCLLTAEIGRRKNIEKALKRSEERFRVMFEQAAIGVALVDTQTSRFILANNKYCDIVGYTAEELRSMTFQQITHPDDLQADLDNMQKLIEGKTHEFSMEKRYYRKNGAIVWIHLTVSPMWAKGKTPDNHIAIIEDISLRKRMEEKLRESNEQIQLLMNSTDEGIIGLDTKGVCTFVNTSCLNLLNYTADQLRGRRIHDVIHYKRANGLPYPFEECKIFRALKEGNGVRIENEVFWRSDGSCIPVEYRSFPIFKNNETVGAVVTFTNITERKQIEDRLKKLSCAVEQSVCSIVITDEKGTIQYVNPKFTEMTGYSYDEAIGKNPRILKSGKTTDEEYTRLWECITSGGNWQGEFYNKKKDGSYFWELAEISPIKNEKQEITNFLAIKEDITSRKREEEEREKLRQQFLHVQRLESVGRLAGGIAHDFNNFLMAIAGYADLLHFEFEKNTSALNYITNIQFAVEKAATLTKNLLAFGKKQIIAIKQENLNNIIADLEPLMLRLFGEDIKYKRDLSEKNIIVTVDRIQIEQALMNLAANARDAMPGGGTFSIQTYIEQTDSSFVAKHGCEDIGTFACIVISDTGTGMDEETKKRLFEPFFTTKGAEKGTGLGLSTTYGIVKQHKGYIDVDSKINEGTTFKIYLPVIDAEIVKQAAEMRKTPSKGIGTILVAEDDETIRDLIKKTLEMFGYKAVVTADGEEAVTRFKENADEFNLLIFDAKMPKKDGKKAYAEIKTVRPDIKVIFLSGYAADVIPQSVINDTNVSFMRKPISLTKLVEKINELLK